MEGIKTNQPEIEQVDWRSFADNDQVKAELKKIISGMHISGLEFSSKSKEEVEQAIKDTIASKGFPSTISVSVSEPNDFGQRMIMGMANSPLSNETIYF